MKKEEKSVLVGLGAPKRRSTQGNFPHMLKVVLKN